MECRHIQLIPRNAVSWYVFESHEKLDQVSHHIWGAEIIVPLGGQHGDLEAGMREEAAGAEDGAALVALEQQEMARYT